MTKLPEGATALSSGLKVKGKRDVTFKLPLDLFPVVNSRSPAPTGQ